MRAWVAAGRSDEAEARLRRCLDENPEDVDSLQLLGHVCFARGDLAEAARLIGLAVARAPEVAFLRGNLAEVLAALGRLDEAEGHRRAAAALVPDTPDTQLALARLLLGRGKTNEALERARQVLDRVPDDIGARSIAAAAIVQAGRTPEAIALLREAADVRPGGAPIRVQRFLLEAEVCDWSEDRDAFARLIERWAGAPEGAEYDGLHPFVAWHVEVPEAARLAVTQGYADRILNRSGHAALSAPPGPRLRADGRLRLGYLSADYHNHPTMHLAGRLFGRHDRGRFEVVAYSLGPDDAGEARALVRANVDGFVDLREVTASEGARRIAADKIDILIDLKGFTLDARPQILALRPAPVQITWLGYPATLGAGLVDYAIVDGVIAPPAGGPLFGEALIRMPDSYQISDAAVGIAASQPTRRELGLPGQAVVFACFNASYKIEPRIFAAWMRVLGRVPGSVLWLYRSNRWCEANLRREARLRSIDPTRLVFADTLPRATHLARLKSADLVLDTHFINAHTGAADALWTGVPLITCPGSGFPSRVAASALAAAGLPELICDNLDAYEDLAVQLAGSREARQELRERLARRDAPYFDTARFVRALERAFEAAWRRNADGLRPESFSVSRP